MLMFVLALSISASTTYYLESNRLAGVASGQKPAYEKIRLGRYILISVSLTLTVLFVFLLLNSVFIHYDFFVAPALNKSIHIYFVTQHSAKFAQILLGIVVGVIAGIWLAQLPYLSDTARRGQPSARSHKRLGYAVLVISLIGFATVVPASIIYSIVRTFSSIELAGARLEFREGNESDSRFLDRREEVGGAALGELEPAAQGRDQLILRVLYAAPVEFFRMEAAEPFLRPGLSAAQIAEERTKLLPASIFARRPNDPIFTTFRRRLRSIFQCARYLERRHGRIGLDYALSYYYSAFTAERMGLGERQALVDRSMDDGVTAAVRRIMDAAARELSADATQGSAYDSCGEIWRYWVDFGAGGTATFAGAVALAGIWNTFDLVEKDRQIQEIASRFAIDSNRALALLDEPENQLWKRLFAAILLFMADDDARAAVLLTKLIDDTGSPTYDDAPEQRKLAIFRSALHSVTLALFYSDANQRDDFSYLHVLDSSISGFTLFHPEGLDGILKKFSIIDASVVQGGSNAPRKRFHKFLNTQVMCYESNEYRVYLVNILGSMNNFVYLAITNSGLWDIEMKGADGLTFFEKAELYAEFLKNVNFRCFDKLVNYPARATWVEIPSLDTLLRFELAKLGRADIRRPIIQKHFRGSMESLLKRATRSIEGFIDDTSTTIRKTPVRIGTVANNWTSNGSGRPAEQTSLHYQSKQINELTNLLQIYNKELSRLN